jgi:hypothetical protein
VLTAEQQQQLDDLRDARQAGCASRSSGRRGARDGTGPRAGSGTCPYAG